VCGDMEPDIEQVLACAGCKANPGHESHALTRPSGRARRSSMPRSRSRQHRRCRCLPSRLGAEAAATESSESRASGPPIAEAGSCMPSTRHRQTP
jgi:hypothetical protein